MITVISNLVDSCFLLLAFFFLKILDPQCLSRPWIVGARLWSFHASLPESSQAWRLTLTYQIPSQQKSLNNCIFVVNWQISDKSLK